MPRYYCGSCSLLSVLNHSFRQHGVRQETLISTKLKINIVYGDEIDICCNTY